MRFPQVEVEQLLREQFEHIETIWDQNPYNAVNAIACTIKELMHDNRITDVREGMARFLELKRAQSLKLAALGLGAEPIDGPQLPSSPRLATQAA